MKHEPCKVGPRACRCKRIVETRQPADFDCCRHERALMAGEGRHCKNSQGTHIARAGLESRQLWVSIARIFGEFPLAEYGAADAINSLSRLIDRALDGEDVIIARHGKSVAELWPVARRNVEGAGAPVGFRGFRRRAHSSMYTVSNSACVRRTRRSLRSGATLRHR